MTPVIYAAKNGHVKCLDLLLQLGADKDATDMVRTLMIMICPGDA